MNLPSSAPVVVGEVLFDRFPDGREILGGAPFNVAWHLRGFGLQPRLVTRVGDDAAGERVRRTMADWGMASAWVQTDTERPTGRVVVTLNGDEASYDIPPEQAFDRIAAPDPDPLDGGPPPLLYHGTLALRAGGTAWVDGLRGRCSGVFLDVNLRDPWWDAAGVRALMSAADWVKLNHHELTALDEHADAVALCRRHGLRGAVVTEGSHRVCWFTAAGVEAEAVPPRVADMADTVGAGDAFSAVCLTGLGAGWEPATILERAAGFAADVCRQAGATAPNRALYARRWSNELRSGSCEDDRN